MFLINARSLPPTPPLSPQDCMWVLVECYVIVMVFDIIMSIIVNVICAFFNCIAYINSFILTNAWSRKCCYYCHFRDEKTGTEKLSSFLTLEQLVSCGAGNKTLSLLLQGQGSLSRCHTECSQGRWRASLSSAVLWTQADPCVPVVLCSFWSWLCILHSSRGFLFHFSS